MRRQIPSSLQSRKLDGAVAVACGWPAELSDDEILKRPLTLNLQRAAAQETE